MSNIVQFLEGLGGNAAFDRLSSEEYAAAVAAAGLDAASRQALLSRDIAELNRLLGGQPIIFCGLFPAENDEPTKEDEGEDDGEGKEAPPRETDALAA